METKFDANSLPAAIKSLFEANNYDVTGPIKMNGAEIDLVARARADIFGSPIYIECTVEYVDNDKYGRDTGKFLFLREQDRQAHLVLVSSTGFSLPVRERASAARIETFTYEELFKKFERFQPYIEKVLSEDEAIDEVREMVRLERVYEEPLFEDEIGKSSATEYLTTWVRNANEHRRWLIVVGDYGTGKTALTRVLLRRWMREYVTNPTLPLPIRIELRDFSKQFDSRGLLHHFLDNNGLSHISIEYVEYLMRHNRVVLLLDGYDEMAQYMHARERRACLEALSHLGGSGAKGMLTSRPSYFSEAEEFQVAELLYSSLQNQRRLIINSTQQILEQERRLDNLLQEQFLKRLERVLQDLDELKTSALVEKVLSNDPEAKRIVLNILQRVFRNTEVGEVVSLSGKPVIVTYLLEIAEDLKQQEESNTGLSEWQVYELIVEKLMLRDFKRSAELLPDDRLAFLERLAVILSVRKDLPYLNEEPFKDLVRDHYSKRLAMRLSGSREEELDRLVSDLRSSATLTRANAKAESGIRFSHNSIREFLCARLMLNKLAANAPLREELPISNAMRSFVSGLAEDLFANYVNLLTQRWPLRHGGENVGQYLSVLFDGLRRGFSSNMDMYGDALRNVCGSPVACDGISISRMSLSSVERPADLRKGNFSTSQMSDVSFARACCRDANFSSSLLDAVDFREADLEGSDFSAATLASVNMTDANLVKSDFSGADVLSIVTDKGKIEFDVAVGWLAFNGAKTDPVDPVLIYMHSADFEIPHKICRKLLEGGQKQYLGLTQRGVSQGNTDRARDFLDLVLKRGYAVVPHGRPALVEITDLGRAALAQIYEITGIPDDLLGYFAR